MTLLSAAPAADTAAATTGGGGYSMYLILILAVAAFWFMSRKSRKQQRAQQEFRSTLQPGDEVMTASGMIGVVVDVDDDTITLESAPGSRTRWVRAAIAKKVEAPVADDQPSDEDGTEDDEPADQLDDEPIDVPDDLSSLPPTRGDDDTDRK
ncbi:preprotein translocase subunit YajC [Cellulomonas palmilytica]|uniref:preprotein translocase subunit YajC n=1 Tax=Cellulomonas palmilytica TaxID=2608402 RepID=UPI001F20830E|nr:preprotein translocase subunit YajC [Cellulomonas palmilytica]